MQTAPRELLGSTSSTTTQHVSTTTSGVSTSSSGSSTTTTNNNHNKSTTANTASDSSSHQTMNHHTPSMGHQESVGTRINTSIGQNNSKPINITIPMNNTMNLDIKRNSLEKSPGLAIVNSYKERKYKLFKQEPANVPTSSSLESDFKITTNSSPRNRSVSSGSPVATSPSFETLSSTSNTTGNVNRNNITIDSIHHHQRPTISNFVNNSKPLNTLSPPSPTDITPMVKKRSNSFDENSASVSIDTEIIIEDENGKQDKSHKRAGSIRHHQREKFQLSGESLFRKPSPKRSQSEDAEKYYLNSEDLTTDQNQSVLSATSTTTTTEDSKNHFHVQSLPSRAASSGVKKTFPTNWITPNNSNNKFKGIGNPEYNNSTNTAHAIKHTFKEFKKNIKDEVKKGVSTVKNAPSFIKSVPKKIMPNYLAQPKVRGENDRMSLDIESFDFDNYVLPPEQKREAIGELYVTDIQTRNLKSVEGYNTNETTLNTSVSGQPLQKRVKSLQSMDILEEENTENILFEDYVTYCEILCEGKKHTTMNLGGAYLNKKLKWQEEFKFYISDESSSISIEIFHSPPKAKSKNEIICLGFVSIPLNRVKLTKDRILDDWFSLITPLGTKTFSQVHLHFQYIPYQNPALSAKDLELLDRMSLHPSIPSQVTSRDKPERKTLLDSLNIDVSDDLLVRGFQPGIDATDSATDVSQSTFVSQTPRSYALYDGLLYSSGKEQVGAVQKVKEELQCTEKTLMNEIHNLKLDLLDTKKRVNDAHEQSRLQITSKNVTIDKLKNKVEKMESRMNHLSTIVLQLNSAQAITKDKVTSHEEDIKLYESRLKELESKVNSMHSARISTKLKEWIFYLLAFLLFFFSQILVLTGFVFNKIKLRRPPTTEEEDIVEDDENEESTFNTLRKRMEGVQKKYRDMAMKTNTPLGNMPGASPTDDTTEESNKKKETFLSQITKVAVMLPFKKSPLDSPVVERKPTMSFSTLERQNELKDLLSPRAEESSDSEEVLDGQSNSTQNVVPITNSRKIDFASRAPNRSSNSSDDEDNAKYSVEKPSTNNRIFEDVSNTASSAQSPNTEAGSHGKEEISTHKVVVPEHQQSYLFNQLKQSFNEEEEVNSPQSAEATSPQPYFEENSSKSQQSIIEEAEKLQTISQFFRKSESTGFKKRLSNATIKNVPIISNTAKANNEEEEDFDSWFNNKIN